MMLISRVLAIVALMGVVHGFSNTSPVIMWSSISSNVLNTMPSQLQDGIHTLALVQSLLDTDSICDYDAVIIIEQPGLHAFDLRSLSAQNGLFRRVDSSPSSRQYPYVHSHPEFDAVTIARMVSSSCQSQLSRSTLGNVLTSPEHQSEKHVFSITMPALSELSKTRKDSMIAHESLLSQELDLLAGKFTKHLVIFLGSPLPSVLGFLKRQATVPESFITDYTNTSSGILNKYQLLTPALITSLLVFFFIILPIVFCGINALASIQNPIRMDMTKSFNALEKKNQ